MPSAVEAIFARLVGGGWALIEGLKDREYDETLHLDFKVTQDRSGKLDKDARRNLSKALSGFANSEGGLLMWGVDARRQESTGPDRVVGIQPIEDIRRFLNELDSATPDLVSPFVVGVRHTAVEMPDKPNAGVVITLIPESDCGPHMATAKDLYSYFRRSGSTFRILEHNEVADLFGRRPHAVLKLSASARVELGSFGPSGRSARLVLELVVENLGRGLGRFVSLSLGTLGAWRNLTAPHIGTVQSRFRHVGGSGGWWLRYAAPADEVVYSDDSVEFARLTFYPGKDQLPSEDLALEYRLDAADFRPILGTVTVSLDRIHKAVHAVVDGLDTSVVLATTVVPSD